METITTYGVGPDQPTYNQLREQNRVLREALHRIAAYGSDGICPFGCDTPHIAQAALTATSQEG